MQNEIRREIQVRATKQRVYRAIADPEQVVNWFPETLEGAYAVGEQPIFGFGDHGRNQICVVAAEPHDYFAYRWVPGGQHYLGDVLAVPNTLVEFRLAEHEDGSCTVTLIESGFAELGTDWVESAYQQNSQGWDFMLGRLQQLMQPEQRSVS